jgi:predicted dithiol-disulfide oxidoreductase (DUF899 family)
MSTAAGTSETQHKVVSRKQWLAARKELLAKEKRLTRERDALAADRRALPWVRVDTEYVFDTPGGKKTLGELFDGRSQLLVYHFMFAPEWEAGCLGCSFVGDHIDGTLQHLANRDVTLVAVPRTARNPGALQAAHGLALPVVLLLWQPLQSRFPCLVQQRRNGRRKDVLHLPGAKLSDGRRPWPERFLQRPSRQRLPHLFDLGTRRRGSDRHLQLARPRPQGRDEQDQKPIPVAWVRHHDSYRSDYFAGEPALAVADGSSGAASSAEDCCKQHS